MADWELQDPKVEATWREFLTEGGDEEEHSWRDVLSVLPGNPRCRFCNAPLRGAGGTVARIVFNKRPSAFSPRLCNACDDFAIKHQGGAEVELSMLFADVRGSTSLAEGVSPSEFSRLINRFYVTTTRVLERADGWIDKLAGDEVAAFFFPGFAGELHARRAIEVAQELLRATGHSDVKGPWVPVGVGVHTGTAFMGSVGSQDGLVEITALGDAVNVAARLASEAGIGEIVASEEIWGAAGMDGDGPERRRLELKGKHKPVDARILSVGPKELA